MNKGYYRRTAHPCYECRVCGKAYPYARPARDCCLDQKPVPEAVSQAQDILANTKLKRRYMPTPRTQKPGNGILWRDKWGHWRRGKKQGRQHYVSDYFTAWNRLQREIDQEQMASDKAITDRIEAYQPEVIAEITELLHKLQYEVERLKSERVNHALPTPP